MNHRMTVTEALAEAGGVLQTGNKSKVVVLRRQANGILAPIAVNVSAIYKGRAADNTYLVPGDQIVVPGNKQSAPGCRWLDGEERQLCSCCLSVARRPLRPMPLSLSFGGSSNECLVGPRHR